MVALAQADAAAIAKVKAMVANFFIVVSSLSGAAGLLLFDALSFSKVQRHYIARYKSLSSIFSKFLNIYLTLFRDFAIIRYDTLTIRLEIS